MSSHTYTPPSTSSPDYDDFRSRALGDGAIPLIADTAHDLCNLASNLRSRLYLTRKLPHQLADHLTALEHLIEHLDGLVDKLTAVSRPELDDQMQALVPLNLNEVVAHMTKAYEPVAQCQRLTLT